MHGHTRTRTHTDVSGPVLSDCISQRTLQFKKKQKNSANVLTSNSRCTIITSRSAAFTITVTHSHKHTRRTCAHTRICKITHAHHAHKQPPITPPTVHPQPTTLSRKWSPWQPTSQIAPLALSDQTGENLAIRFARFSAVGGDAAGEEHTIRPAQRGLWGLGLCFFLLLFLFSVHGQKNEIHAQFVNLVKSTGEPD